MLKIENSPVSSSPQILGGTLVFKGTRVPVQTLLDYINDGFSVEEFIDCFPSVSRELTEEFL